MLPTLAPSEGAGRAFAAMAAGRCGVAVVAEADGTFVGTVTDGALRRAWLTRGLERPVADLLSLRPVVVDPTSPPEEVAAQLRASRLRAAPVVEDGRVVGARTAAEVGATPPAPSAVLMVGGRGERLLPLTAKVPKPLLRIGGTSIVERILRKLGEAGVRVAWLAVKHMAEQFEAQVGDGRDVGIDVRYVHEHEPLGSAGPLTLVEGLPDAPVLVTNGDLVTTVDYAAMVDFHRQHAAAITVAAVEHRTLVPYGVLRTAEHHVLSIDEKPERRDLVNAGMYVLEPELIRLLEPGAFATMPDLVAAAVAEGLPVHAFPVLERWIDIGSPEEFERVLHAFATGELE